MESSGGLVKMRCFGVLGGVLGRTGGHGLDGAALETVWGLRETGWVRLGETYRD